MQKSTSGFTLVELLIVIVVIAILAAITIVAYNGVQDRARVSGVQSDLTNAKQKLMLWKISNGHYPESSTELPDVGMQFTHSLYDTSSNNLTYCVDETADEFALGGKVASSDTSYFISSNGDIQKIDEDARAPQVCDIIGADYPGTDIWASNGFHTASQWANWTGA